MTFNMPTQQYLFTSSAATNRGTFGTTQNLATKSGGNLPITTNSAQWRNNTASSQTGTPAGIWFGLDSQTSTTGYDVSTDTRVMLCSNQWNAPNRIQQSTIANEGTSCRIVSGTTEANYKNFFIGGNDTPYGFAQDGSNTFCIDLNASGQNSTTGTFDNTNVSGWGFGTVRFNLSGTSDNWLYFIRLWLLTTTKDSVDIPTFTGLLSDWDQAFIAIQGSSYTTTIGKWLKRVGTAYFVPIPFQFGDGTAAVTFNDGGVTVVSPENNASQAENFRLTTQAMRVYLSTRANAADIITLSGTYVWGTAAVWDFNQSTAGVCTVTGAVFTGMGNFTLGSSVTGGATFNLASGSDVIIEGANLNGSTINGDLLLNTDTDLTNITVTGDLRVNIGANATLAFDNVTVTGNIFNDDTGSTLTVNATNSSVTAGDAGTGNGQTNLINTVTLTVNVTRKDTGANVVDGTQVYILLASDHSIIESNGTTTAGVYSDTTYNYTADTTVDIFVRNGTGSQPNVYVPQDKSNTITNTGMTQNFQMIQDVNNN